MSPIEAQTLARAAGTDQTLIKKSALAPTVELKPIEGKRIARGSTPLPKQYPRGPRRRREKLSVDQILPPKR